MSTSLVHPAVVERRLVDLSKEVDEAHDEAVAAERTYFAAKGAYEVGVAKARLAVGREAARLGNKITVQEREDEATVRTEDLLAALYTAEAVVKAARANVQRLRVQVDLTRSVSANVRSALDLT